MLYRVLLLDTVDRRPASSSQCSIKGVWCLSRCRSFYLRSGKCRYGRHRFPGCWTAARSAAGAAVNIRNRQRSYIWNKDAVCWCEEKKERKEEEGRCRPYRSLNGQGYQDMVTESCFSPLHWFKFVKRSTLSEERQSGYTKMLI